MADRPCPVEAAIYGRGMPHCFQKTVLLAVFLLAPAISGLAAEKNDEATIRRLNTAYLDAFLTCNVARYRELLADDFRGVLADGREIDKAEFLKQSAVPPPVTHFRNKDIAVRIYGDTALVNARAVYNRPDGAETQTRYVTVYVRRQERWQVVSTQLTRIAAP